MTDPISEQEAFEHAFHYFLEWLEVMTMEPIELCNRWGNYNVAWELVTDLKAGGNATVSLPSSYLSEAQKREISCFLNSLDNIPASVLVAATTVSANLAAMSHPCWVPYRKSALALLQVLEPATARNRVYFLSRQIK